jgi:hypothetical protein
MQMPVWQVSVRVQALPSLQLEPSTTMGFEQPLEASQVPGS